MLEFMVGIRFFSPGSFSSFDKIVWSTVFNDLKMCALSTGMGKSLE